MKTSVNEQVKAILQSARDIDRELLKNGTGYDEELRFALNEQRVSLLDAAELLERMNRVIEFLMMEKK